MWLFPEGGAGRESAAGTNYYRLCLARRAVGEPGLSSGVCWARRWTGELGPAVDG